MESRTPRFCNVCGTPLVEERNRRGFDAFTGEPTSDLTLYCPNPDTTHSTSLFSSKVNTNVSTHPTWAQIEGVWSINS